MKNTVTTGVLWDAVLAELEQQDFEEDFWGDCLVRRVFLGTVMSLSPSGKYYMPWACSNLSPCPECHGVSPETLVRKRLGKRRARKYLAVVEHARAIAGKRGQIGSRYRQGPLGKPFYTYARKQLEAASHCPACNGMGSREAYLDEQFWELLEEEAGEHDCYIENGEGDPCDVFICQSKERDED